MITFRKKIVVALFILALAFGSFLYPQPKQAQAFLGIDFCGTFLICLDPLADVPNIISAGANTTTAGASVVSAGTNTVTAGISTAKFAADGTPWERVVTDVLLTPAFCDSYGDANLFLDTADRAGKLIAGADPSNVTNTFFPTYKVESTQAILDTCWVPLSKVSQAAKGATISQAENVEHNRALIQEQKKTTEAKVVEYEKVQDQAFSDVFQGILVNFTEAIAHEGAVKAVNVFNKTFGVDADGLVRALTNQVFAIKQIDKNSSGSHEAQLIAASLFKNKTLGDVTGLTTAVNLANEEARKYQIPTSALPWEDSNFYTKMSKAADPRIWTDYHLFQADASANQAITAGHELAHSEVATGNGYKNVRVCTNITADQSKINADLAAATSKVNEAFLTLQFMQEGDGDLTVAKKNYADAQAELEALKSKIGSSLKEPCPKGIVARSQTIAATADQWVAKLFPDYKKENPTLIGAIIGKLGKTLAHEIFNDDVGSTFASTLEGAGKNFIPIGISAGLQGITGGSSTPKPTFPPKPTGVSGPPAGPNPTSAYLSGNGTVAGAYTFMPRGPEVARGSQSYYQY